ncbi:MAG: transcription termination/antitermination protein NusG [Planctomycetes bacterium]|nr:transcription termination/antitermination protein NusG [Planctomycetota bacterium]
MADEEQPVTEPGVAAEIGEEAAEAPPEPDQVQDSQAPENQGEAAKAPPAKDPAAEASKSEELVREGMQWYVLRVASAKEDQVCDALERKVKIEGLEERVGRILVPTQKEKRLRGGSARVYRRKLYPGYVFVEMATESDGTIAENVWFVIKETLGVGDFIGSGGKPTPMKLVDVEKMLSAIIRPEDSPTLANLSFKQGDKVKVREGPFENFEGVVDEINSQKGTVRVIVTIFGRATPIEIEYWQVEPL